MKIFWVLFLACICLLTMSCQPHKGASIMSQQLVTLGLNEQGVKDFRSYSKERDDYSAAKMGFLTLRWRSPNLGTVEFRHGSAKLTVQNVFLAIGTQYISPHYSGVQVIDVDGGLNTAEFVSSQDAYLAYVKLMEQINQNGWQQYFRASDPRIAKQNNLKYALETQQVIDPEHIFSYEEWQQIMARNLSNISYRLYNDGVILGMNIMYSNDKENKQQFMVRYDFQTVRHAGRSLITGEDKITDLDFQKAFGKSEIEDKNLRQESEREMKAKGYGIDEDYVDLDILQYAK